MKPDARDAIRAMSAVVAAATMLLIAGCADRSRAVAARNVPYQKADWTFNDAPGSVLTTEHYQMYTTLRDPVLVDALPQAMETAYAFYRTLVPAAREPREPMPAYLFATRTQWVQFTKRLSAAKAPLLLKVRNGGYSERGVNVIEYVAHQVAFPVVAHEGFHQYLYHCVNRNVPAWLNEGLAVLCEGQRWDSTGLREIDPYFNPMRRNALAEVLVRNEQFTLEELLRTDAGHVVGGSSRRIDAFYGQVWALVLFLRDGEEGKYAERFNALLAALPKDDLETHAQAAFATSPRKDYHYGQALFSAFISDDFQAVDREYQRFMKQRLIR